ncbi:MAG: hypothetical protein HUJ68_08845, partial [Clostridia bacterium]|nr:hypothetical protein [Clostridia bacterium]
MEYIIIAIISGISIIILGYIFDYNLKKIKGIVAENELDEIAKEYPSNLEICKWYLKKLKNEKVKIEESKEKTTSLYIAITDKIIIANIANTYTRIQTIAHECIHSVQDRRLVKFNFVFSNIYI